MQTAADLPGHVKVRLAFNTWEPVHLRSQVLKVEFKVPPPYIEYVSVWLKPEQVFPRLSAYQKIFDRLLTLDIVPERSKLINYVIMDEDTLTLAYHEGDSDD